MNLNGMDKLEKHLPDLASSNGRNRLGLYALGLIAIGTSYFITSDNIPTWSIDSQILIVSLGLMILSLFFRRKRAYQEKYRDLAYRNAILHYGFPGFSLILSAVAHAAYMNGPFVPHGWWTTVFIALGWIMLITGAILWIRTFFVFGVDNLSLIYVYFPEEGRLVISGIYNILRHPLYAGIVQVMFGLAFLNGNANALIFTPFVMILFIGWVRLVEEKELIERFGQSYLDYRKRVPAFWPKMTDLLPYFRFLLTGK
jgi:protein-S-isoprenylcysteine O-methyltransferase Ste14